ncbi:MAG TPA: hypothetical protein VMU37_02890, partial [Caulobacteraceae bacterium]|nr:hypothetical protein [Caulobacteraceae bacterium]
MGCIDFPRPDWGRHRGDIPQVAKFKLRRCPAGRALSLRRGGDYLTAMIPRYARPEAAEIWSPQTRFKIMFEIEA